MNEYNIVDLLIQDSLERAIKYYGLEGCEEAIKRVYKLQPTIQQKMLQHLWNKLKGC